MRFYGGVCFLSNLAFIGQMMLNPGDVGAIVPSSRTLADHIALTAGVREANLVIEYGPGTGAITRSIVMHAPDPSKVICLEINDAFVGILRREYPEINVRNDSATGVLRHVRDMGHDSCDAIVSGLPFASFDDRLQNEILEATYDALAPGGRFVTFSYCCSGYLPRGRSFQKNLSKHFNSFKKSSMIWKNFPPAFTLCATK